MSDEDEGEGAEMEVTFEDGGEKIVRHGDYTIYEQHIPRLVQYNGVLDYAYRIRKAGERMYGELQMSMSGDLVSDPDAMKYIYYRLIEQYEQMSAKPNDEDPEDLDELLCEEEEAAAAARDGDDVG